MPRIIITDDNQNWLNWGKLVRAWIKNTETRPTTVADLQGQLGRYEVNATIDPAAKSVVIRPYPDGYNYTLEIDIPTEEMFDAKFNLVKPGPYPRELMPTFYDIAYAGAPRANLSLQQAQDFALRRVGEYTVNECC